jgi:outer membrane immunogenic protein
VRSWLTTSSSPNVMLNLEYQYVDLGSVNLASSAGPGNGEAFLSQSASASGRFQVVTFGISWLFTPTSNMSSAPWQGGYVGGHVGAAWGNDTTASYFLGELPP